MTAKKTGDARLSGVVGQKPADGIPPTLAELRVPIASLKHAARNPRRGDVELLVSSLAQHGQYRPIVVNSRSGEVLAGNHTLMAARELGWTDIAATFVDVDEEQAARIALIDNRANDLAGYDERELEALLSSLPSLDGTGWLDQDLDRLIASLAAGDAPSAGDGALAARFGVPPFTVLDARAGSWQERKRAWIALGIQSEIGREENLLNFSDAALGKRRYDRAGDAGVFAHGKGVAVPQNREIRERGFYDGNTARFGWSDRGRQAAQPAIGDPAFEGTSIFDPVLCELACRWFSPPAGRVLDPFAGGSVRGIVASRLGRDYTGVELRPEQIAANDAQADRITPDRPPHWLEGDARDLGTLLHADERFDLLFSCPPYFDLEVYSDDPRDLSRAADYAAFSEAHAAIIAAGADRLRDDRFACWVVSEIRDTAGAYRGLVPDTIRAFQAAGLQFYNEAILVTAVGSLPIRVGRHFSSTRKLGRTHQNVLVFLKGNARAAVEACGDAGIDEAALDALEPDAA